MTKAELIAKGKTLGLNLSMSSLKSELEAAVKKAEKANTPKTSAYRMTGEK